jgi:hypothetical protein
MTVEGSLPRPDIAACYDVIKIDAIFDDVIFEQKKFLHKNDHISQKQPLPCV